MNRTEALTVMLDGAIVRAVNVSLWRDRPTLFRWNAEIHQVEIFDPHPNVWHHSNYTNQVFASISVFELEQKNEQPYPHLATRHEQIRALSMLPEVTVVAARDPAPTTTGDRVSE